ncbi:MAG TPA: DJ-1/PfpI family protein, partial [Pseudonocardia sp.]|nr:DJ-1/PfpI family protein [Pseudonocardia sp.]
ATETEPAVVARIGIYIYPNMTQLDVLGPHQALGLCPGLEVFTFARTTEPLVTDTGLTIVPDYGFDDVPACDVLLVGGTANAHPEMIDPLVLSTLTRLGGQARYVTSVCTGALILAAAGLLDGYRAATHWSARELLATFPGVERADERVVVDRNRITGGGVTAGIDFALTLIGVLIDDQTAQLVQLVMEYNPAPPYNTGHPDVAPAELVAAGLAMCEEMAPELFGARSNVAAV